MERPVLENVSPREGSSFKVGIYQQPYFSRSWHYHPEAELLLIISGYGKRLVGDHVSGFKKHDLVLLGGNLPHAWVSDPVFYDPNANQSCKSIYIQFDLNAYGDHFLHTPEMESIRELLQEAARGISIQGRNRELVIERVKLLRKKNGLQRFLDLLSILKLIKDCKRVPLASQNYLHSRFYSKSTRINRLHEFIMENFKQDITLKTASGIACMNVSSFARFFKIQTGTTFSEYLNRIRIDFATKLLAGTELPITQISFESGYNSLTYFNKKFKDIMKTTPGRYRLSNSV